MSKKLNLFLEKRINFVKEHMTEEYSIPLVANAARRAGFYDETYSDTKIHNLLIRLKDAHGIGNKEKPKIDEKNFLSDPKDEDITAFDKKQNRRNDPVHTTHAARISDLKSKGFIVANDGAWHHDLYESITTFHIGNDSVDKWKKRLETKKKETMETPKIADRRKEFAVVNFTKYDRKEIVKKAKEEGLWPEDRHANGVYAEIKNLHAAWAIENIEEPEEQEEVDPPKEPAKIYVEEKPGPGVLKKQQMPPFETVLWERLHRLKKEITLIENLLEMYDNGY